MGKSVYRASLSLNSQPPGMEDEVGLRRQRQKDLSKLEASLVYVANSRPSRTTY